ncbi:MAG: hypothetical protein EH225_05790 [Calditrichaeota bacterium]|nr:hypothetical protein [Calditrichota bacterium]RQW04553.1 MAG: hypothetical protein EH225_05790 [Calditrichota bacterium]
MRVQAISGTFFRPVLIVRENRSIGEIGKVFHRYSQSGATGMIKKKNPGCQFFKMNLITNQINIAVTQKFIP